MALEKVGVQAQRENVMDDVERVYRQLVKTLRASYPQYLTQPFEVGELVQNVIPYRLHRRELGFETNRDYELALLSLLSGAHGYLVLDDKMRDVLSAELSSATPDTARLRDFAATHIALAPEPLQRLDGAAATPAMRPSTSAMGAPAGDITRRDPRPVTIAATGEACRYCKGALPAGRPISFCPHCGQDLTVVNCPACGSELESGWKFCATCGRGAGEK
ncbi:MAG: Double zinc ribbon [Gemmatimonadetes bacterium]|nr:Double zinc ribbon [Gemmatimonadota bacterium]